MKALSLYAILAVLFTYPLAFNIATRAPVGEAWTYDGFSLLWNVWWFKHALLDLNVSPFYTNSIFAPLGAPLALHSYTLFDNLAAIPLLPFVSVVTASNLIVLASITFCGYSMYLLALDVLSAVPQPKPASLALRGAAFAAGVVFAFSTQRFVLLALGHYNFVTAQFAPFYMLYLRRTLEQRSRHALLLASVFLALSFLVELSLGVMLVLLSLLFWLLVRATAWRRRVRELAWMFAVFAVAGILASPYFVPAVRESFDPKYIPQYWGGAPVLSSDLLSLFTPSSLSALFGTHDWPREWQQVILGQARFFDVNIFVIGIGVALFSILGALVQAQARRWFLLALILVVLSLGPVLHVNKQSVFDLDGLRLTVGLPYILLHYIPILNGLRAPQRFAVVATMAFALPVGFAVQWLSLRISRGTLAALGVAALACVLVSAEHLLVPVPLHDTTVPPVYARIAQEPGDFTVLDVPLGWRSGFGPIGTENTRLQYYQTVHQKNLVSGFAARTPSFIFDYFARQPILHALAVLESEGRLPAGDAVHDPALAAELAYFFDLRYILIHAPSEAPTPYHTTFPRVRDYVLELFDVQQVDADDGITVWRVQQPEPRAHLSIDFGTDGSSLNRAEGWERDEQIAGASANWMNGLAARVFVPLRLMGNYRLTMRVVPLTYTDRPEQRLSVRVNGQPLPQSVLLADGWNEYVLDVPAAAWHSGLNELVVSASSAASPAQVLPANQDARSLSIAVDWIQLDLQVVTFEGKFPSK